MPLWMLRAFVNCARTVLPALTSVQWYYQKSINGRIYGCKLRNEKKFIPSALRIFTTHIYIGSIIINWKTRRRSNTLKGPQRMGGGRIFLKIFRASLPTGTSCSKTYVSGIFISFSWHVLWKCTYISRNGWDLAEWLERLTAIAEVATVMGSIPASSESGIWGAADEAVLNTVQYIQEKKSKNPPVIFQEISVHRNEWNLGVPRIHDFYSFYWITVQMSKRNLNWNHRADLIASKI